MADLKRLYDDVIMDHIKNARNYHELEDADQKAEGFNALCGDKITVYLKFDDDLIEDAAFVCSSCGISMAAASVMTEAVKGKSRAEAKALFHQFTDLFAHPSNSADSSFESGQLAVFAVVREFPARINCATLAWHTLDAALEGREEGYLVPDSGVPQPEP